MGVCACNEKVNKEDVLVDLWEKNNIKTVTHQEYSNIIGINSLKPTNLETIKKNIIHIFIHEYIHNDYRDEFIELWTLAFRNYNERFIDLLTAILFLCEVNLNTAMFFFNEIILFKAYFEKSKSQKWYNRNLLFSDITGTLDKSQSVSQIPLTPQAQLPKRYSDQTAAKPKSQPLNSSKSLFENSQGDTKSQLYLKSRGLSKTISGFQPDNLKFEYENKNELNKHDISIDMNLVDIQHIYDILEIYFDLVFCLPRKVINENELDNNRVCSKGCIKSFIKRLISPDSLNNSTDVDDNERDSNSTTKSNEMTKKKQYTKDRMQISIVLIIY